MERIQSTEKHPEIPFITDPAEALEYISDRLEQGEHPVVTVPNQYADELSNGLKPHTTWIPGLNIIAGTIGRLPYLPPDEKRIIVEVDVPPEQIKPRFTGPENAFQGVVIIEGPIPREKITIH